MIEAGPNATIHPTLQYHIDCIFTKYKDFLSPEFRETVLNGFKKLSNDIFRKSDERATRHRLRGNELYQKQSYYEALKEYDEAVLSATWVERKDDQDSEICLGLSNRSAALLKLDRMIECLSDIELAMTFNPSEKLLKKLDARKKAAEKCDLLEKVDDGQASYDHSESHIVWTSDNTPVADRDLNTCDLINRERAILSTLKSDYCFTRCYNCFANLSDNWKVPCRGCSQVKFCSLKCSQESWNSGHNIFCLYLNIFDHLKGKEIFEYPPILACLQVLSLDLTETFKLLRRGDILESIENLSMPEESDEGLNQIAQATAHLLTFFTITCCILPESNSGDRKYDIELLGGLLMMFLRKMVYKSPTSITCLQLSKSRDASEPFYLEEKVIGFGIFSSFDKLSYSCDPNTSIHRFEGRDMIVRATRTITKGAVISSGRGVDCRSSTVSERKKFLLKNYKQICKCTACENGIQPICKAYLCPKCNGPIIIDESLNKCSKCPNDDGGINIEVVESEIDSGSYNLRHASMLLVRRDQDIVKAEDYLLEIHKRYRKILHPLNENMIEVCKNLSFCYKKMRKYRQALIYAEQAYHCIEAKFNPFHFIRINGLFYLIDRKILFLIHCKKKRRQPENEKVYPNSLSTLQQNIAEASLLLEKACIIDEYYETFLKQIKAQIIEHGLSYP
ncbi:protein-lysine N-methyltransferase SMYD4-like [Brevipalpus obovatus]|uniref:protein-lysine N-methyltransferase SMYD4-like n=1 Tax=Brevipalpus obovatus TaxID=246614 RepID=UPI003D9FA115